MPYAASFETEPPPRYMQMPTCDELDHIPGDDGWPLVGRTYPLVKDLVGLSTEHVEKYGPVSRIGFNFHRGVLVLHPDQFQQVFMDPNENFSSTMGYANSLGQFFGGAFIFQDFDIHMWQRRIFQRSFTVESLQGYMEMTSPIVREGIEAWGPGRPLRFLDEVKRMLLDVAARVFFGLRDLRGAEAEKLHQAYRDIADKGVFALIKRDIPGLKFHAGLRGQRVIDEFFRSLIPARREKPGRDMFSMVAQERDDHGDYWPDELLIPQLGLIQFAAHDTTSAALSHLMMYLAKPEYQGLQERLRQIALSHDTDELSVKQLRGLRVFDDCVHEALRLHPSLCLIPRRNLRECELGGHRIPPNTLLYLSPNWAHRSENWWTKPSAFDPERFSEERQEQRSHRFAYVPFGGGAHKCIGMHFALLTAKLFLHQALRRYRFTLPRGYDCRCGTVPLAAPSKGLPMIVKRLD